MRMRLVVLGVMAALLSGAPAHAAFPGENGKIAYTYEEPAAGNPGDVHVVNPDGSGHADLTPNPLADIDPAWSPDGTKIAYSSRAAPGASMLIWTMNEDGTAKTAVTTAGSHDDLDPAWTADGRIGFVRAPRDGSCSLIHIVDPDGTDLTPLPQGPECRPTEPAFSPDGTRLAYFGYDDSLDTHGLYVADSSNGGATEIVEDGRAPNWSPGGPWLAYSWSGLFRTTPDGLNRHLIKSLHSEPAWSPDGSRIVYAGIRTVNDAGGDEQEPSWHSSGRTREPDWQPVPPLAQPGYARPKSATPMSVSLVPAYVGCGERMLSNREHGPPLAFASCAPPAPRSDYLTVGTPDANGAAPLSTGSVTLKAVLGDLATPANEADLSLAAGMTDVRCASSSGFGCAGGTLSDYPGSLRLHFALGPAAADAAVTVTDKFNGGTGRDPATYSFTQFQPSFTLVIPCSTTPDADIGSTCAVSTTMNAILPGAVLEGKRATWQFQRIWLMDGGEDGDGQTADDNTLFASQGVFVP